ncbi:oleate hydratase, partial [Empedobacter falsenii]
MSEFHCLDIEFPDVDFSPCFESGNTEVAKSFHAHLYVSKDGNRLHVTDMGFNTQDRMKFLKLFFADENDLDNVTICDWFDDHFFTTNFWYMWQTTFAWQEW